MCPVPKAQMKQSLTFPALDQICDGKNQIGIAQMEGKMFPPPPPPPFFRAFELYDHLTLNPLSFHSHPLFLCFAVIKFGGFTSFVYGHGETHPITFVGHVHVRSSLFNGLGLALQIPSLGFHARRGKRHKRFFVRNF